MVKTRSLQLATRLESQMKSFGRKIVGFLAVLFALGFHQGAHSQTTEDKTIARKLFQGGWDLKANANPLAAIVLFESGLKLEPENRLAHLHLGVIYEALGDASSAKQHYSEVIRLAPQSAEAAKARIRLAGNAPKSVPAEERQRQEVQRKQTPAYTELPVTLRFSHIVASDTPKGKAAEFFARRAAELTRGKVRVEVYANSALYMDKEELEALQLGAVQMLAPSLAKFAPLGVKEFELFDLPFLFDNATELHRVVQGPIGDALLGRLQPKGITGLAFWDNGFKSFSLNSPIRTPEDFRGKKIRIQSRRILEEQVRALGALPQVMAFSEVYAALQGSVVDGTENPLSNLYSQKMHEVQKHLTLTEHGYLGYAVIVNRKFWESLPADLRASLELAMKEATDFANRAAQEENDAALEAVKRSGRTAVHVPSREERLAFKKALAPVHKKVEVRIGGDLLRRIYQATGFDPSRL